MKAFTLKWDVFQKTQIILNLILKFQNADWTEQYTVALFKALSHMLCIGYGNST